MARPPTPGVLPDGEALLAELAADGAAMTGPNNALPPLATPNGAAAAAASLENEADPLIGSTIGSFKVVKKLGVGGMGTVYLGEQGFIGSKVAIKVLHPHLASNPSLVQRFYAEARAANVIGHEHIVSIIDLNLLPPNRYYFIMEYLEGKQLSELPRPVPHALLVHILTQICDALQAAHTNGVVHRDLKPENIVLIKRGRNDHFVKILDFGIAKLFATELAGQRTAVGVIMGTPEFMAPEQTAAEEVDGRTDLYSLGVIAYELATGTLPFTGSNVADLLISHRIKEPVAPIAINGSVDPGVSSAIMKALAKQPADRWQTADDFCRALEATLTTPYQAKAPITAPRGVPVAPPAPDNAVPRPRSSTPTSYARPPGSPGGPPAPISPPPEPPARAPDTPVLPVGASSGSQSAAQASSGSTPASSSGTHSAHVVSSASQQATPARGAPSSASSSVRPSGSGSGSGSYSASASAVRRGSTASAVRKMPEGVQSWEIRVVDAPGSSRSLRATDLSRGGMFVHTEVSLPPMFSRLKVSIVLPDGELPLKAEVVRHVTPEQSAAWGMPVGFGLQFVELTASLRDDLNAVVKGAPRASGGSRPGEQEDSKVEETLKSLKNRGGGSLYELLGMHEDADFADVRQRCRDAKKLVAELLNRSISTRQRESLEEFDKRYDEAMMTIGQARNRLEYDANRANWKGIARCIAGGVSVSDLDHARRKFLAAHKGNEGTAHLHFTTGSAWESQRNLNAAQTEFERALVLDPLNLSLHQRYQALKRAMTATPPPAKK